MTVSPAEEASGLVTFEILVDGAPINESYNVTKIWNESAQREAPHAVLTLLDGDVVKGEFPITDGGGFPFGRLVEIKLGYDNKNTLVFRGHIEEHRSRFGGDATSPMIDILCTGTAPADQATSQPVLVATFGEDVSDFELTQSIAPSGDRLGPTEGRVTFAGTALARLGDPIDLRGFGTRNSGKYRITRVTHTVENGDWTSEVGVSRSA